MAIRYVYGVCTNTDDGEGNMCPLCKSKERQKLLETDDFVCRQCHEQLTKVSAPATLWEKIKWPVIIICALAVIGAIIALIFFSGGKDESTTSNVTQPPTDGIASIELNHNKATLNVGETDQLEVTNLADGAVAVFKASKNGVVSVDADGVVTAVKAGVGKVRVMLKGNDQLKAVCEYTVKGTDTVPQIDTIKTQSMKLTLNKERLALKAGEKATLQLLSAAKDGNKSPAAVSWTSSNPKVVTVDNNGNVVAKAAGTATITVQSALKSDAASPATCAVTVEKAKTGTKPYTGHGTKNLGYGIYRGDLKNGLPHGHGVITYTRQHRIVSSKDFVANPGDRFEGDFRDGRIESIGYWYHDGQQTGVKP